MTPNEFIDEWRQVELKERASAQEHFLNLCRLLELPTPAEVDPKGDSFTFEKRVSKAAGGRGFADVWKRGHFAWEYKGRGKDLNAAYVQLLLYILADWDVTTRIIGRRVTAGETIEDLSYDYDIPPERLEDAVVFEAA